MGILNLKNKTAHKYIKKQPKSSGISKNKKINKIHTVGIVAEADLFRTYDFTKKLSENLGINKEAIKVILFDNEKSQVENYNIFSEKSFGMYGKIKNDDLQAFVDTSFDLLINYCLEETIYGQVVVCKSKAKLKAGFENKFADFYNLSINIPGNKIDTFNKEIIKYLQILKLLK